MSKTDAAAAEEAPLPVDAGVEETTTTEYVWTKNAEGRFEKVPRTAPDIRNYVDLEDNLDPRKDLFETLIKPYKDDPRYAGMEFRYSDDREMARMDIEAERGWVPVPDSLGQLKPRDGMPSYGTLRLVHRPIEVGDVFRAAEREDMEALAEGKYRKDMEESEENLRRARHDYEKNTGRMTPELRDYLEEDDRLPKRVFAGGGAQDSDLANQEGFMAEIRDRQAADAKRTNSRTFGGFHGPANRGAIPDSPGIRALDKRRANGEK